MGFGKSSNDISYDDISSIKKQLKNCMVSPGEIFIQSIDYLNSNAYDADKIYEALAVYRKHDVDRELIYGWLDKHITEEVACHMMRYYLSWDEIGISTDRYVKAFVTSEFGSSFAKGERSLCDLPIRISPEQYVREYGIKGIVESGSKDYDFLSFILDYQRANGDMSYLGKLYLDEFDYDSEHIYDIIELIAHGADCFDLVEVINAINPEELSPGAKLYYRDTLIIAGLGLEFINPKLPLHECYMEKSKHAEARRYYENPKDFASDLKNGENQESIEWFILHPEKIEFSQEAFYGIVGFSRIQTTFIDKQKEGAFGNFVLELFKAYLWAKYDIYFLIDQFINCNRDRLDEYKLEFGHALNTILTTKSNEYCYAAYNFCLQQLPLDEANWVTEAMELGASNNN